MNKKNIADIFLQEPKIVDGVYVISSDSLHDNQAQTNAAFSEKWTKYSKEEQQEQELLFQFQREWYLNLYGFNSENDLKKYLRQQSIVLDAGCGLGYKAKWFADMSPETLVIGLDYSDAVFVARKKYESTDNIIWVKGDIADTRIKDNMISFVSCDQVIHHTEVPQNSMDELTRVIKKNGELAVYVYAKKALPRELLDDYFRNESKNISSKEIWQLSEQLTKLGQSLTDLNIEFDVPDIPLLGIKGGKIDLQRFIYWNFLKCFWNSELGRTTSVSINFDWYAPSNAERYYQNEFLKMIEKSKLETVYLKSEEAFHSGRFKKI
jgi:ubiquinone/menaquinone biosynthesis C-methylase UbiE